MGHEGTKCMWRCCLQAFEATRWDQTTWSGGTMWQVHCCGKRRQSWIKKVSRSGYLNKQRQHGKGIHESSQCQVSDKDDLWKRGLERCKDQLREKEDLYSHWESNEHIHEISSAYHWEDWLVLLEYPNEILWRWWWRETDHHLYCHAKEHLRGWCAIAFQCSHSYKRSFHHGSSPWGKECKKL